MFLKLLLFVFLFSASQGFSQWKKGDDLGYKKLCTYGYEETCWKLKMTTTNLQECDYVEDYDSFGNLILPTSEDYDNLLRHGNLAKDWECKTRDRWAMANDVFAFAMMTGAYCAATTANIPLVTLFGVFATKAWLIDKLIHHMPCVVLKDKSKELDIKNYLCRTVKGKSGRITCDPVELKYIRKFND